MTADRNLVAACLVEPAGWAVPEVAGLALDELRDEAIVAAVADRASRNRIAALGPVTPSHVDSLRARALV